MGIEGLIVLLLIAAVLVLLVLEKVGIDAIGIGVMVSLIAAGFILKAIDPSFDPGQKLLGVNDALQTFGNPAVIMVAALYVMGEGLSRTGAVEFFAGLVMKLSGGRERRMILSIALTACICSAFLNNTAVVVVFIPVLVGMAKETGVPITRLLIPMAFGTILGGMTTLVGTSTNILVSGVAEEFGYRPIGMFEMAPVGITLSIVGILFISIFARYLLPSRQSLSAMMADSGHREYVTELTISEESPLIGKQYTEVFDSLKADLLFFVRGEAMMSPPFTAETVEDGDIIMVRGTVDCIANMESDLKLDHNHNGSRTLFNSKSMQFFEIAIAPHSPLIGRKLDDLQLFNNFGALPVALLRNNQHLRDRITNRRVNAGDLILATGDDHAQQRLRANPDYFLLTGAHKWVVLRSRARRALGVVVAVMAALTACSIAPEHLGLKQLLPVVALVGAVSMVTTGCLTARRAYRSVDWSILIFMIGAISLGKAMENTGVAQIVGSGMVHGLKDFGPHAALGGLTFLAAFLSSLVSNQAVAVLLAPVAINAARTIAADEAMGADQTTIVVRAFILAIAMGSSVCFSTPVGHQSNLMVYGPGGYKWRDFLKVGVPVSIICWIGITIGVPLVTGAW
ncbi:MAG: SLC13 family permease [Planctomycetota bacterium]|jgi:di/tricarboxylate transporter|nr:SLC13 family permease [Planctomycetota bacterium]